MKIIIEGRYIHDENSLAPWRSTGTVLGVTPETFGSADMVRLEFEGIYIIVPRRPLLLALEALKP